MPLTRFEDGGAGRFTAMLQDELRVNSGLTYHPVCRLDEHRLPGAISISAYSKG
jgi:hypothetical protein